MAGRRTGSARKIGARRSLHPCSVAIRQSNFGYFRFRRSRARRRATSSVGVCPGRHSERDVVRLVTEVRTNL